MKKMLILTVVLLTGIAATAQAKEIKKDYHKVFEVNASSVLHLENGDGNVTITPWNKNTLDVTVHYHADLSGAWSDNSKFEVLFEKKGNDIHITEEESHNLRWGRMRILKYTYDIKAPPTIKLDLKGSDGDLVIRGWKSDIDARLSDGDIRLSDIQANVKIRLSDGDLHIDKLKGNLKATGSDGDMNISQVVGAQLTFSISDGRLMLEKSQGNIRVRSSDGQVILKNVKADQLDIKTSDGAIDANLLASGSPKWRFRSSDGNIRIRANKSISASYSFKTSDGSIRVDHPNNSTFEQGGHYIRGRFGSGKGSIDAASSDGNISLRTH